MFKLTTGIPSSCFVAVSGGVDSMVLFDFVSRARKNPVPVYFNHGTEHGDAAEDFLRSKFKQVITGHISSVEKPADKSWEEHWRDQRYRFFHSLQGPVLTAHHLGDAVEWWLFTSLHGCGKLTAVKNKNVWRPLLMTSKADINSWAERKGIQFIEDPSNQSRKYMRNVIRHDILPHALKVNPGLETVVRNMYLKNNVLFELKE